MAGLTAIPSSTFISKNLQSALKEHKIVDTLIKKELDKGYIIGPFHNSPFSSFPINLIGIATQKYSGKKILIINLSSPHNSPIPSINSLIPEDVFSLMYASVDHAIQLIKFAGRGSWLAKADITDAFKIILAFASLPMAFFRD